MLSCCVVIFAVVIFVLFCLVIWFRLFFIIFIVFHYPENKFSNNEFLWSIYGFPEYLDLSIKTNLLI